jgi:cytochrome b involved in lipid metabolism
MKQTRIAVAISLFLVGAAFIALVIAASFSPAPADGGATTTISATTSTTSPASPTTTATTAATTTTSPTATTSATTITTSVQSGITASELAKHSSPGDCWTAVSGKVYDLTDFLSQHSGGAPALLPYCGKDGTSAFQTKDLSPPQQHNRGDLSLLRQFYVGDLATG